MHKMSWRSGVFIIVGFLQLGMLGWMIAQEELTLAYGKVVRFQTMPIDPLDPFRGRFVAFSLQDQDIAVPTGSVFQKGDTAYARLQITSDGVAHIVEAVKSPPPSGLFFQSRVQWVNHSEMGKYRRPMRVNLTTFNRFYMNEKMAPEAERAYRALSIQPRGLQNRPVTLNAYVEVAIWNGHAVLKGFYIADQPVADYLKSSNNHQSLK